jgi:hypothetical protein
MDNTHLIYLYIFSLATILINVLLILLKKPKLTKYTSIITFISLLGSYIGSYLVSGHLPVYDKFGTLQNINLVIVFLALLYNRSPKKKNNINSVWFFALFFQLLVLTQELKLSGDYYMYGKYYVVLFFQLRITSMGLFLFAAINQISAILKKNETLIQDTLMHRARNFTILGSIVFLAGEFSGSYWCYLWWGDPWHWSKGFFIASVMFLLSMISGHLPYNLANTRLKKSALNLIALCLILITYLLPH